MERHCSHRRRVLRRALIASGAVISLMSTGACASAARLGREPLVTDRPDFTESAETVLPGMTQVEAGVTYTRTLAEREQSLGELLVRVGMTPGAELRIGLNSYDRIRDAGDDRRGLEDALLGAKFRLTEGGGQGSLRPAMALLVASTFPTGAREIGAPVLQPEAKLAAAWDLTSRVSFSSNLNYALVHDAGATHGEAAASGSLGIELGGSVGSYVEYFAFFPRYAEAERSQFMNAGFTLRLSRDLQLDARGGLGLNGLGGPDYFVGVGLARRW